VSIQDSKAEIFDVFLCHNSEDKPAVREIFQKLADKNVKSWLDERGIRPGTSWQTALEQQIDSIKAAAVFVGDSGVGPWQRHEIQAFLNQFVRRKCPVIPVVLDSAKTTPKLPLMLENLQWVDFRVSDPDPLEQLLWGITGQKPAAREPLIPGKRSPSRRGGHPLNQDSTRPSHICPIKTKSANSKFFDAESMSIGSMASSSTLFTTKC
jgi:hypothetical protein